MASEIPKLNTNETAMKKRKREKKEEDKENELNFKHTCTLVNSDLRKTKTYYHISPSASIYVDISNKTGQTIHYKSTYKKEEGEKLKKELIIEAGHRRVLYIQHATGDHEKKSITVVINNTGIKETMITEHITVDQDVITIEDDEDETKEKKESHDQKQPAVEEKMEEEKNEKRIDDDDE